jgi:tRNA (guanine-N7-)-methyltransferase
MTPHSLNTGAEPAPSLVYVAPNWVDPLDPVAMFGRPGPLEIDVGCGKGGFLLWAAAARPAANFLGIDRLLLRLRKVDKKLRREGLLNARLVRLEASYLIGHLLPDASVAAYHIYFPDPWPKRRHHRRRLFTPEFVRDLERTLVAGGVVNVATDHAEYFEWIRRRMVESGMFLEKAPEALPAEAQTEFEKGFLAAGKPIYRARFERRAGADAR